MIAVAKTRATPGADPRSRSVEAAQLSSTVREIDELWLEHEVVFFRDQGLTPKDHIRYSEQLGEVEVHLRID